MASSSPKRSQLLGEALSIFGSARDLYYQLTKQKFGELEDSLFIPMATCCNTAVAIGKLLHEDVYTECEAFMLMRALLEKLVNYNYLRLVDDDERERFFLYGFYRAYHSTLSTQESKNGKLSLEMDKASREKLAAQKEVKRALEIFSATNPKLTWSKLSFRQRVTYVSEHGQISEWCLSLASLITYSDASEVLHGSFYGDVFLTGAFTPGAHEYISSLKQDGVSSHISRALSLRLCVLATLFTSTTSVVATKYNLQQLVDDCEQVDRKILHALEAIYPTKELAAKVADKG